MEQNVKDGEVGKFEVVDRPASYITERESKRRTLVEELLKLPEGKALRVGFDFVKGENVASAINPRLKVHGKRIGQRRLEDGLYLWLVPLAGNGEGKK